MDLRLGVADIANRYQLSLVQARRLYDIAALEREPEHLRRHALAGIGILGAILAGLGVIFWIAANWSILGRAGKFALLEVLIVVSCLGAIWRPQARVPLGLVAFLTVGGLFALIGQTYQSGADPWQLFALWAVLTLPMALSVRHDAVWIAWIAVCMTAIGLWVATYTRGSGYSSGGWVYHLPAWILASLVCAGLSPLYRTRTGAGDWSLRFAITLTVLMVSTVAISGIFDSEFILPFIAFCLLGNASYFFAQPRYFDLYNLSVLGLALNSMILSWLVRLLFKFLDLNFFLGCLILGVTGAIMLSLTVKDIMKRSAEVGTGAHHA